MFTLIALLVSCAFVIFVCARLFGDVIRHWGTGRQAPRSADTPRALDARDGDLGTWTDAALYAVWRATDARIATGADSPGTAAQARQLLLAEIEHRYPRETLAWLSSSGALNGQPPQFLRPSGD